MTSKRWNAMHARVASAVVPMASTEAHKQTCSMRHRGPWRSVLCFVRLCNGFMQAQPARLPEACTGPRLRVGEQPGSQHERLCASSGGLVRGMHALHALTPRGTTTHQSSCGPLYWRPRLPPKHSSSGAMKRGVPANAMMGSPAQDA